MQWFYGVGGQQQGPVSTEDLKALIAGGSLPPETVAWREGMGDWQPVSQLSELAPPAALSPPGSPSPPPPPPAPRAPAPVQAAQPAPAERARRQRPWPLTILALLWMLTGVLMTIGGGAGVFLVPPGPESASLKIAMGIVAGVGGLLFVTALGLWALKGWGRNLALLFAALALLGIPIGTVLGIVMIAYLLSPGIGLLYSGKRVEDMSAEEAGLLVAAQKSGLGTALGVLLLLSLATPILVAPIAAIAIPNFLNAVQRGKQKRTMGDMRVVATAIEQYAIDQNAYPEVDGTAGDLEKFLVPTYVQFLPTTDGWNNALVYEAHDDGSGYLIGSYGKDGVASGPEEGPTSNFNDDIFLVTGVFVTYPEGSQG